MAQKVLAASRRDKEKKALFKIFLALLAVFVFFVLILAALFSLDSLKINTVSVSGNEFLTAGAIEEKVKEILGGKIFGLSLKNRVFYFPEKVIAAALLADFPRIKTVQIENDFSPRLEVRIEERKPVALLCQKEGGECFYLDEGGFVFDIAPHFSSGVFLTFFSEDADVCRVGGFLRDSDVFRQILSLQKKISVFLPIEGILLKENDLTEFHTARGFYLILNTADDLSSVYKNFSVFFDEYLKNEKPKNLEYVDLRFGNKIYFK